MFRLAGIRVNTSPSLPVGFYIRTRDPNTKLVEFCPAEPFASFAAARGYRTEGNCGDGATPLLKAIIAVPGDIVETSALGITVNGTIVPNTQPKQADTFGRPMYSWPYGSYTVANGTVWVASSHDTRSFDSRYFGPVAVSSIRGRLRPLLTE